VLADVTEALEALRTAEQALDEARARFRRALTVAHEAGVSYAMLATVVGMSRQRVAQLVAEHERRQGG
jgi:DNA-directed RNA polymerase specialized sigma24 family protein